ncbi:MAG TPA: glycoside hydrolase family 27 protein [Mycobacterium sp.]|nr:glycoside hydrolase family 27 protein [Mycobacterium sp.]
MRRLGVVVSVLALVAVSAVIRAHVPASALDNGLARTPPMGWNGFNHFRRDVTESIVKTEAQTIVASGMQAAGYRYVNLDGGWDLLQRDPDGQLQPDPAKFPHGIKALADFVHSLGLKFGIYASAGLTNCAATSAGSYGHYQQDADTFASWGVDYVKLDWCVIPYQDFPDLSAEQVAQLLGTQMGQALAATRRPMVYDINDASGARNHDEDWTWAPGIANLWRVTSDIADTYTSMVNHFCSCAGQPTGRSSDVGLYAFAGPGGWNDPDMLEVGNGGMTNTEYQAEFSLWAEMAAPLIAGNDLGTMSAATQRILTNRAVIAVDQDPLGKQGYPVTNASGDWVLSKQLANGDRAVVLFNQNDTPAVISTSASQIGLPDAQAYLQNDLWRHAATRTTGAISATVPAHAVVMYRVTPIPAG